MTLIPPGPFTTSWSPLKFRSWCAGGWKLELGDVGKSSDGKSVVREDVEVHSDGSVVPELASVDKFLARAIPAFVAFAWANVETEVFAAAGDRHVAPVGHVVGEVCFEGDVVATGERDDYALGDVEAEASDCLKLFEKAGENGSVLPHVFDH